MLKPDLSCAQSLGSKEEQEHRIHLWDPVGSPSSHITAAQQQGHRPAQALLNTNITADRMLAPALGWAPCKLSYPSATRGKGTEMGKGFKTLQ